MSRRSQGGFTVAEMVVAIAVFGALVLIMAYLGHELSQLERRIELDWFTHPEMLAVVSRVRSDVLVSETILENFGDWSSDRSTLILALDGAGSNRRVVVYDFSESGVARRHSFRGTSLESSWTANGVPRFEVGSWLFGSAGSGVSLHAVDDEGRLLIDRVFAPRKD